MRRTSRLAPSLVASLIGHAAAALLLFVAIESRGSTAHSTASATPRSTTSIVWLSQQGLVGGGGGGGNRMKAPPRQVQRHGRDDVTIPISPPHDLYAPEPVTSAPAPLDGLRIPAVSLAAATEWLPGTVHAPPGPPTDSLGPGKDGGAGDGEGPGDGPGKGRGLGPGRDRGEGGDVYRMGGGVTPPVPLYRGEPRYTSEAVQARIQGSILVECIVQTNGQCTNARVLRSFEPPFGLDREAIVAAGKWRFRPGLRGSEQVPVLVTIEVAFSIR